MNVRAARAKTPKVVPLPFAPRPLPDETFTSWVLRLAGANQVTLDELIGVATHWEAARAPTVDAPIVDYGQSARQRERWAMLARVSEAKVRSLDLTVHFPHADEQWLLQPNPVWSGKVRFGYCRQCFGDWMRRGLPPHLKPEWSLAVVTRCMTHGTQLYEICPYCGIDDPVSFVQLAMPCCRRCWHDLAPGPYPDKPSRAPKIVAVQRLILNALWGKAPKSEGLEDWSAEQFLRLVAELIWILTTKCFCADGAILMEAVLPRRSPARHGPFRETLPEFNCREWCNRDEALSALAEFLLPLADRRAPCRSGLGPEPEDGSPIRRVLDYASCRRRSLLSRIGKWPKSFQRHIARP